MLIKHLTREDTLIVAALVFESSLPFAAQQLLLGSWTMGQSDWAIALIGDTIAGAIALVERDSSVLEIALLDLKPAGNGHLVEIGLLAWAQAHASEQGKQLHRANSDEVPAAILAFPNAFQHLIAA